MKPTELDAGHSLPLHSDDRNFRRGLLSMIMGVWFVALVVIFVYLGFFGANTSGDTGSLGLLLFLGGFLTIGLSLCAYGAYCMIRRTRITIDHQGVDAVMRDLNGTRNWKEPLSDYLGVLGKTEVRRTSRSGRSRSSKSYLVHFVYLKHARTYTLDVPLLRTCKEVDLRAETERFAKLVGLPVLIEKEDNKYEVRPVADLDKSVAQLAAENKLEIPEAPTTPLSSNRVRSERNADGYTFEGLMPKLWFSQGVIALVVGGGLFLYSLDFGGFNPASLVFLFLVLLGLGFVTIGPHFRFRLEVSPRGARYTVKLGGHVFLDRVLPASSVEEVKIAPGKGVNIVSDHGTITFGPDLTERDLQNVRDAVLATLANPASTSADADSDAAPAAAVGAAQMLVLAEMNAGHSPAQVWEKLKGLGNADVTIAESMRRIAEDRHNPHAAMLGDFLKQRLSTNKAPTTVASPLLAAAKIAGFLIVPAIIAYQFLPVLRSQLTENPPPASESAPAETAHVAGRFGGFDIKPGRYTGHVYVAGRGIRAEAHGADLHIRIEEILLEKKADASRATYSSLGVNVIPGATSRREGPRAVWNREVRGDLDSASPSTTLLNQVFVVPGMGPKCATSCKVGLLLGVQTPSGSSHAENTGSTTFQLSSTREIAAPDPSTSKYWDTYYHRAVKAKSAKRYEESERLFRETLAFIDENLGADHPAMARTLVTMAHIFQLQKRDADYETAMTEAHEILDKYSDAETREKFGTGPRVDKELVARHLGDFYWEQNDFEKGYVYYKHAYAAAPELETSDYSRNLKLAYSSAGIMATACMLQKYEEAAQALAELKQRARKVKSESREHFDYWIETGESRIKNRQCG
ncbi:MAG: tetratricopeptide repeat protein [Gammaproteobacteria bacterium]|nr:tetratricopeptide repeat protein [Gammaproteobacteria bacterium]